MDLINLAGLAGATTSFAVFVPQARRVWTHRHDPHALEGVSAATQLLLLTNAVLWVIYGFGIGAFWTAAPSFVNFPLGVLVLTMLYRSRRTTRAASDTTRPEPGPIDDTTGSLCGRYIAPADATCRLPAWHPGPHQA